VDEAAAGVVKLHKERQKLQEQLASSEASHAKASSKLQEERATLTRFDAELKDLEHVIKEKKQAVSDAELHLKKIEHDVQALAKDKAASANFVSGLERQFEWIEEEKE
jgi:structural maintenance of chromosome 2